MDLRKLKTMIELVQQSGIAELEVTEGEERVRIVRGHPSGSYDPPSNVPQDPALARGAPHHRAGTSRCPGSRE
jgi:acetyl-CoA carboxylase biotin carboxyl carrier protein